MIDIKELLSDENGTYCIQGRWTKLIMIFDGVDYKYSVLQKKNKNSGESPFCIFLYDDFDEESAVLEFLKSEQPEKYL